MKVLYGFRHSIKDKENNISEQGLQLARVQGKNMQTVKFERLFRGELIRTAQTRDAFAEGYVREVYIDNEPVLGLGSDALFGEMVNGVFKALAAVKTPNFDALLQAHADEPERLLEWRTLVNLALFSMFDSMEEGECSAFFGHSPVIELMASACFPDGVLPEEYHRLPELAGIIFQQADDGETITVTGYIPAPVIEPAV